MPLSLLPLFIQSVLTVCLLCTGTLRSHTGKKSLSHRPCISDLHLSGMPHLGPLPLVTALVSASHKTAHLPQSSCYRQCWQFSLHSPGAQGNGRCIRAWPPPKLVCTTCNSSCEAGRCSQSLCGLKTSPTAAVPGILNQSSFRTCTSACPSLGVREAEAEACYLPGGLSPCSHTREHNCCGSFTCLNCVRRCQMRISGSPGAVFPSSLICLPCNT